jgi:hypothetical protein
MGEHSLVKVHARMQSVRVSKCVATHMISCAGTTTAHADLAGAGTGAGIAAARVDPAAAGGTGREASRAHGCPDVRALAWPIRIPRCSGDGARSPCAARRLKIW